MAFDQATVMAVLEGEGTNEEKFQKIYAEHESEKKGLEVNKNKILGELKALQKTHEELSQKYAPEIEGYKTQIQELEEKVKKSSPDDAKAAFEAQLKRKEAEYEALLAKSKSENDKTLEAFATLTKRRCKDLIAVHVEDSMTKLGITDPEKRTGMRKAFLYDHESEFAPGDDDDIPVNKEYKTINEVMAVYAATPEGMQYIPNKNNGGGAPGNSGGSPAGKNTMTRSNFDKLSDQEKSDFCAKGGQIQS
jgi:alkylhydroperoxidase/carboxymuconolactone decarboxylase family protein YurZ